MTFFHVIALILTLVACFGYLNYRFVKLPEPVGITAVGLLGSVIVAIVGALHPGMTAWAKELVGRIDFSEAIFHGMLGPLLFAGALHLTWDRIGREKWAIVLLATLGVAISALIVGTATYYAARASGLMLPFLPCLLFGTLISPTDPIAVLGVLRKVGVPAALEMRIVGESLFNDGTGVVLFIAVAGLLAQGGELSMSQFALDLAIEVAGGLALGGIIGGVGVYMLRGVDSYAVEILITLSMATAGYALAESLHTSAPIAVVIMGLLVGNQGKQFAMSDRTKQELFSFWQLVDELLTLLLFGLIALEFIALEPTPMALIPALGAIPIVLLARLISVAAPMALLRGFDARAKRAVAIMTWGGLRGGISVALALSLPDVAGRNTLIMATYGVVLFSLLVQATTLGRIARALMRNGEPKGVEAA